MVDGERAILVLSEGFVYSVVALVCDGDAWEG